MKPRYTIAQACQAVADALRDGDDHSATTIRCAINDHLDAMEKDGYTVNHAYDQRRAIIATRIAIGWPVEKQRNPETM